MRPSVSHALERHQVPASIDDADADDLFELFGLFDGGVDDYVAAFLTEFKRWYGFHDLPPQVLLICDAKRFQEEIPHVVQDDTAENVMLSPSNDLRINSAKQLVLCNVIISIFHLLIVKTHRRRKQSAFSLQVLDSLFPEEI